MGSANAGATGAAAAIESHKTAANLRTAISRCSR
jgi:hypothetical protein